MNITAYGPDNVLAGGPEQAMSYMESKFFNAAGKMAKNLASDLYKDGESPYAQSPVEAVTGALAALDNGKGIAVVKSGYMLGTPSMEGYAMAA